MAVRNLSSAGKGIQAAKQSGFRPRRLTGPSPDLV